MKSKTMRAKIINLVNTCPKFIEEVNDEEAYPFEITPGPDYEYDDPEVEAGELLLNLLCYCSDLVKGWPIIIPCIPWECNPNTTEELDLENNEAEFAIDSNTGKEYLSVSLCGGDWQDARSFDIIEIPNPTGPELFEIINIRIVK